MAGQTATYELPYATGSDPVVDGDDKMQELADRLELVLPQSGATGLLTVTATATDFTMAVVFPRAYPAGVIPRVVVTPDTASASASLAVDNITETGFTLVWRRTSGAANIGDSYWIAVWPT